MKTCSETFQFEKDLKWENPAPGVQTMQHSSSYPVRQLS